MERFRQTWKTYWKIPGSFLFIEKYKQPFSSLDGLWLERCFCSFHDFFYVVLFLNDSICMTLHHMMKKPCLRR